MLQSRSCSATPSVSSPPNGDAGAAKEDHVRILHSGKNLYQFLEIGRYFDYIVVDSNGHEHRLHKILLACHSDYFQAIFDSSFLENTLQQSRLTFPDPRSVLPDIFRYMYTHDIAVSPTNIIPLMQQAEYYQVSELKSMLTSVLKKEMLPKHVIEVLRDAVNFWIPDVVQLASAILAENFDAVAWDHHGDDLNFLPVHVFLDVLSNRALTLDTEYRVYKVIANYTNGFKTMSEQDCYNLYSKVYFEHLTVEQLEEAYENPHVPRSLLCEGLFASLRMALGKPVNQERLGRKYTKHMDTKRGRDFVWSGKDFDTQGIIYWLGTQLDEQSFQNPQDTGHLICTMSSIQIGQLVSRQCRANCTMSEYHAFILMDLGPSHFVLKPAHYSLRHGYYRDNVNLRRWRFEASNDGIHWDTLSLHDPDDHLGGTYGTHTWPVVCERWYRMFRIQVIGKFFIQVCGWEMYGNLLPRTLDAVTLHQSVGANVEQDVRME